MGRRIYGLDKRKTGKTIKELQSKNILFISITLLTFHFDIAKTASSRRLLFIIKLPVSLLESTGNPHLIAVLQRFGLSGFPNRYMYFAKTIF